MLSSFMSMILALLLQKTLSKITDAVAEKFIDITVKEVKAIPVVKNYLENPTKKIET